MSSYREEKRIILSADFHRESSLPPISRVLETVGTTTSHLDEDDGLFLNYGRVYTAYPYRYQDMYDRNLKPVEYDVIVLENESLKAVFIPSFGGKLWSLIDKKTNKDLLFSNDVVRPANLAVRNAWTSGGIEWNCGFKGHHPYTCSLINTAKTELEDGTPVLRFYYYERIRCSVVQMDFFLPDGSEFLYVRNRITNPNDEMIPMYWWSNVAVVQKRGDRVIVPAEKSYTVNDKEEVIKIPIPLYNKTNVTYPENIVVAKDFFWTLDRNKRPYIAQLDMTGYGLCQTSTGFLKGRKMFVWGDSQGGRKWMNFLTADEKSGAYDEIQCGLACTQYECLPMPPHTVWEWLEGYGAISADKEKIHSEWTEAQKEVERILDARMSNKDMERLLAETSKMAHEPAELLYPMKDGWGALELFRRERCGQDLMNSQLDFGDMGAEQECWLRLLTEGTVGVHSENEIPVSYMKQKEWLELLETAVKEKDKDNWYAYYLLGTAYISEEKYAKAEQALLRSMELKNTAWSNYALAVLCKMTGNQEMEVEYLLNAYRMRDYDISLAKEVFRSLYENEKSKLSIKLFAKASEMVKENKRCLLYYAYALAKEGRISSAEEILCGKDGKTYLIVPDIREGETTITDLWFFIQEKKGIKKTHMGEPPRDLDFRMQARHDE